MTVIAAAESYYYYYYYHYYSYYSYYYSSSYYYYDDRDRGGRERAIRKLRPGVELEQPRAVPGQGQG